MAILQDRRADRSAAGAQSEGTHALLIRFGRILLAWLAGSAIAYVVASVAHTQTILAALGELGVHVVPGARLATSLGDLAGLWRYGLVVAVGLALGLLAVRAPPRRLLPLPPLMRNALAGALAVASVLFAMRLAFPITPIASDRGAGGFALQCLAGTSGGTVFSWCLDRLRRIESRTGRCIEAQEAQRCRGPRRRRRQWTLSCAASDATRVV